MKRVPRDYAAARPLNNCLLASAAPSESALSFAQAICGCTRPPSPQSVDAITFSRRPLREALDPVGDDLRVLDHVGRVADDARQDLLAVRQLDVLPDPPLVLVADVGRLERVVVAR